MDQKRMKELKAKARQAEVEDDEFSETPEAKALDVRMAFARCLIAQLKSRNMTQAELCRRIGMKPAQMSRIVNAEENVTLPTINRIAEGFGITMSGLLRTPSKSKEEPVEA